MARSPRFFKILLTLCAVVVVMYLARSVWLPAFGFGLIHSDEPAKADIAVVLAGDYYGRRIEKAAELIRAGYVPAALVDGPAHFYGNYESTLAVHYIVAKGNPPGWFIDFPMDATSTQQEASLVLPELRRRNIHSYLLVTSAIHSGRARRIFLATQRAIGFNPAVRTVLAANYGFGPSNWWHSREGKKAVFIEWCKTVATALGQ